MPQIILTSGATWVVPPDWNDDDNSIEGIGGAGCGFPGEGTGGAVRAGGGAAYAKEINVALTPGSTVEIQIGLGGSGVVTPTATYFKNNAGTKVVEAAAGVNGGASSGAGGLASASTGSTKFSGGTGGAGGGRSGPGGGGAAGPHGDGKNGGSGLGGTAAGGGGGGGANNGSVGSTPTNTNGANGGNNRTGTGGGVGSGSGDGGNGTDGGGGGGGFMNTGSNVGANGGAGTVDPVWSPSHGPSGGSGGGAGNNTAGVTAGNAGPVSYGGGGGSGGAATGGTGTNGAGTNGGPGILVITYTPSGGGGDSTLPTLTGSIVASAITSTSYTLTWPAGADNIGIAGYDYSLNGGSTWTGLGNVLTVNVTGRTPSATDAVRVRARDAAGNLSTPALSANVTLLAPSSASFTSEPLRDNTGTLVASTALAYVALYNDTTSALVVRKTGLSTNGAGVFSFTDAALVAGTTYRVDWETVDGKRRMPRKAAA